METKTRSLAKAISYRIFAFVVTGVVVYLFTQESWLALGVGVADALVKVLVYFFHERMWARISFGKAPLPTPRTEPLQALAAFRELRQGSEEQPSL